MALHVVRNKSDNRVLASYAAAQAAAAEAQAQGSGVDSVSVSDAQQGDETMFSILGKVVSDAGVVSAYALAGSVLVGYRRGQCYDLVEAGLLAVPSLNDAASEVVIHKYLRMLYAAASVDANMTSSSRFNEVEAACKGGDLAKGLPALWRLLVTDSAQRGSWASAIVDTATVLQAADSSGGPVAKSATLPTGWATSGDYHAMRAYAR